MQTFQPLEYGKYYHVYNRGINSALLFKVKDNYEHFLRLYDKYIDSIADTYAWCLMPNHLHLLVRIKEEEDILPFPKKPLSGPSATDRVEGKKPTPYRQFSHLFNAYAQAFNRSNNRTVACLKRHLNVTL
jgi:REP element-mobilizing transposase RayT